MDLKMSTKTAARSIISINSHQTVPFATYPSLLPKDPNLNTQCQGTTSVNQRLVVGSDLKKIGMSDLESSDIEDCFCLNVIQTLPASLCRYIICLVYFQYVHVRCMLLSFRFVSVTTVSKAYACPLFHRHLLQSIKCYYPNVFLLPVI